MIYSEQVQNSFANIECVTMSIIRDWCKCKIAKIELIYRRARCAVMCRYTFFVLVAAAFKRN